MTDLQHHNSMFRWNITHKNLHLLSILPPWPSMGCGVVERHLEMAQPTAKKRI